MTSAVPSPPSAIGMRSISAEGRTSWMPEAISLATSSALKQPLNLSGATTIFTTAISVKRQVLGASGLVSVGRDAVEPIISLRKDRGHRTGSYFTDGVRRGRLE